MTATRIIVYRGYDPVALELVEAQLRAEDIEFVRLGRGNAPLLGVGNHVVEQRIEVAAEDAQRAREIIAELAHAVDEGPHEDPVGAAPLQGLAWREHVMALGASLVWSGFGTGYVGTGAAAVVLALWPFAGILLTDRFPSSGALGLFAIVAPRIVDLGYSQVRLHFYGRSRPSLAAQLAFALALVGTFALGVQQAPQLSAWVETWEPKKPAVKPE